MRRNSEFVNPADDYVTLKEAAIMLAPTFISVGLKLAIFSAIGRYARKQAAL